MLGKYQKFSSIVIFVSFISLTSIAAINLIVDPYGIFAFPKIKGINNLKPEKANIGRIYKAFDIRRINPQIILLGSSRVEEGLNPQHVTSLNKQKVRVYNAGFQAGNTYEVLRYLEHAINQQPELEQVIIGLDFFMFNEFLVNQDNFSETRLGKHYPIQDIINFLLSLDALESSKKTLITSIQNKPESTNSKTAKKFQFWIREFLRNPQLYGKYTLSKSRLENLRSIVNLCQQNNLDLKIFISPIHATQHEAIAEAGLWSQFEQWKREIVKITNIWDFAYHNSISTEVISEGMNHYIDSSHYSKKTGNLVLNRILNRNLTTIPQDFGVLITPKNIESHLLENKLKQEQWRNNNQREVKLVKDIKLKIE